MFDNTVDPNIFVKVFLSGNVGNAKFPLSQFRKNEKSKPELHVYFFNEYSFTFCRLSVEMTKQTYCALVALLLVSTVDSRYLKIEGTLINHFEISVLRHIRFEDKTMRPTKFHK